MAKTLTKQKKDQPTILVTGGTGFAGSHLIEALLDKDLTQIHTTTYGLTNDYVQTLIPPENIHQLDLTNKKATQKLLEEIQPQQIYHLAAIAQTGSSFEKLEQVIEANFKLQLSLLEAIQTTCPTARTLIIGSGLEYLPQDQPLKETDPLGPVNPYAVSKVMQDMLAYSFHASYNLDLVRCRPFNHIGERQASGFVVPDFARQVVEIEQTKKTKLKVGNLDAVRDFTDVKDVVQAYILLMEKGKTGEVYNIGSSRGVKIQKILELLVDLSPAEITITKDKKKFRPIDVPQVIANIDKIRQLGWEPKIYLQHTLERILKRLRHQQTNQKKD